MRQTALPARHQYRLQIAERRGKILGELSIPGPILTTIAQMTDTETVMNLLRKVPLFASLKDEDKVCIEETEEWRLPAGEMLVEEGKHAEHFFVLLEGEISVWKKHADQEIVCLSRQTRRVFRRSPAVTWHALPAVCTRRVRLPANRFSGGSVLEGVAALPGHFR